MRFRIFMSVMILLIPLTMIGLGRLFMKKAPKKINYLFGYRTPMSMKNRDTWEFAHHYFGRVSYRTGWVLLAISVVVLMLLWPQEADTIGWVGGAFCLIQCIPLLAVIYPTEKGLKRNFDKDGNRRST